MKLTPQPMAARSAAHNDRTEPQNGLGAHGAPARSGAGPGPPRATEPGRGAEPHVSEDGLARMSIDKRFHGDLDATSKGEMLSAGTNVQGSAGYVAIERVTGTLAGKSGTFVLQHTGTMTRGAPQLSITVVPDSGTGQLTGLSGTMGITIEGGTHFYAFDYTLDDTR